MQHETTILYKQHGLGNRRDCVIGRDAAFLYRIGLRRKARYRGHWLRVPGPIVV